MSEKEMTQTQYLTFTMRDESFAIEISNAREVLDVFTLTPIPRMPVYLSGVINLRGNVVPVIVLGLKLGMAPIEQTKNTCIMVVEVAVNGVEVEMGILTDSVQMVLDLPSVEIEAVPKMGTGFDTDFIKGMGRQNEKFLIILDINKILASEAQAALQETQLVDAAEVVDDERVVLFDSI
ncbi:MAG: chemotaxis protein CheW [Deltaproteobacteria bacterium]